MEINTEINKIFGTEMAKLFATQVSEEEMKKTAEAVWEKLKRVDNSGWERKDSEIVKLIKQEYTNRLLEAIKTITETDEFKADIQIRSKQIVKDIVFRTEEKMVDEVSNRMAMLSTGCGGFNIRSLIQQVVMESIHD